LSSSLRVEPGFEAEQISVIDKTSPAPTRVFAGRRDVDKRILIPMIRALPALDRRNESHHAILDRAEFGGGQMVKGSRYDGIRDLINRNLRKGSDDK
jgi:ABC-type phosphate/phosphonate transport system substrate-binding protein